MKATQVIHYLQQNRLSRVVTFKDGKVQLWNGETLVKKLHPKVYQAIEDNLEVKSIGYDAMAWVLEGTCNDFS